VGFAAAWDDEAAVGAPAADAPEAGVAAGGVVPALEEQADKANNAPASSATIAVERTGNIANTSKLISGRS